MHAAEHVYQVIEQAGSIVGTEIANRLHVFAQSTINSKLWLLVKAGAVKMEGHEHVTKATFTVLAPLDMEVVRQLIRDMNVRCKGTGRGEGKRWREESIERKKQRDAEGITARVVDGAVSTSRPSKSQPVVTAVAKAAPAWPSPDCVQKAVDAVLDVPLRHLPALRSRLKEILD